MGAVAELQVFENNLLHCNALIQQQVSSLNIMNEHNENSYHLIFLLANNGIHGQLTCPDSSSSI